MDKGLTITLACLVCGALFLVIGFIRLALWNGELPSDTTTDSNSAAIYAQPPPTEEGKIELLRVEADKKGVKWKITSCYWNWNKPDNIQFLGQAVPKGHPFAMYIEDGAEAYWLESGKTQGDAAYGLYKAIQHDPNHHPKHKEDDDFSEAHRNSYPENISSESEDAEGVRDKPKR